MLQFETKHSSLAESVQEIHQKTSSYGWCARKRYCDFFLNSPQNGKSNFLERWRYFANGWAHNLGKHLFKNVKQCYNSSNQDFISTPHRIGVLSFYFSPFESVHRVQSHAQRIHNLVIEKISPVSELQQVEQSSDYRCVLVRTCTSTMSSNATATRRTFTMQKRY